ncbi:MAG TPA: hypothetical protein VL092_09180 [Chitinophagaceae bacterium]|nr:hypothetical protein [Chitinophagaceae bacterium]
MFRFFLYIFCFLLGTAYTAGAQGLLQEYANLRQKKIPVTDSLKIDSLAISSFVITGVAQSDYRISPYTSVLYWTKKPALDSVTVQYRVLAMDFTNIYRHKNRSVIDSNYFFSSSSYPKGSSNKFVDYDQVELNGSYGRSISMGNNQDVVSNSNLNLQVNGYLIDSIKVEAAITDNTIPFQPEGNTSTLQEFDQVSIRLSKNKQSLLLGDYNLNKPDAYFLNYTKRVQGLFFQTENKLSKNLYNKAGLSASMAKGEFARNIFNGAEGNQGPYRLTGNNGEQLFIVLAATEKVYVDNILQERGENADYVIDYNTNEVRFMPRRPINQFSRIQVEFEYRTNNYLNSLLFAYDELNIGKKWQVKVNAYSNQDAKNQGFQQNLSGEQKRFLAGIGDSVQYALIPNISRDTFAANKILYRIRDTVVSGTRYDSVYEYSTDQSLALYSVSFSYVGSGKGDYTVSGSNANGRVYQWRAPVSGQKQGDYSAVSLIITPKMQQLITLATRYQIDSFKQVSVELAGSNKDPNTFSPLDNASHQGIAAKMRYQEQRFFGRKDTLRRQDWTLQNNVQYEFVNNKFRAIAPYRAVEFGRDWNVPLSGASPDEHWSSFASQLSHRRLGATDYSISLYTRGTDYKGLKNTFGYKINNGRINTGFNLCLMNAEDSLIQTRFFKPLLFAEYSFRRLLNSTLGASYYAEHNTARMIPVDSLHVSSFYFDIATVFWRSTAQKKYNMSSTYFRRRDFLPFGNELQQQTHSDNVSLQFGLNSSSKHQLNITASYRQLHIDNTTVLSLKPEQTLLGRLQYDGSLWKRALSFSTLYDFGTGQEQKRNFTYVQVPAGQGMYNWIDYNGDGVQQLNEFVVALYPDQKLYIRIFTPSNEYIKVNNTALNQTLNFEPANFFQGKNKTRLARFSSKISDQLAVQVNNKILNTAGIRSFNPLGTGFSDTTILLANTAFNNTFYYNRSSAQWGLDYNFLNNKSQQLLTYGLTATQQKQHLVKLRFALSKSFTINMSGRRGTRSNMSGVSDGSSFLQQYYTAEPALVWLNRSILRITTSCRYEERRNELMYGGEKADIRSAQLEARYSQTSSGIIQLRFTFSQINYNGLATAPVTYAMLDGLKQGDNFLWYLNWQRRIGKGIELLMEYEGRKAGNEGVINTGRMSLRAVL